MSREHCRYIQVKDFHNGDFRYRCLKCGHKRISHNPPELLIRRCPVVLPESEDEKQEKLLGDRVEQMLTSVGITKKRVEKWWGGPCGCEKRKKKLNQFHAWINRFVKGETKEKIEEEMRKALKEPKREE